MGQLVGALVEVRRDEDDRHIGARPADLPEEIDSVHPRHAHVAHQDVVGNAEQPLQRLRSVGSQVDGEASRDERSRINAAEHALVLDDKDSRSARGKRGHRWGIRIA